MIVPTTRFARRDEGCPRGAQPIRRPGFPPAQIPTDRERHFARWISGRVLFGLWLVTGGFCPQSMVADLPAARRWEATATLQAAEARQAAAVDGEFVYAITNDRIGKYERGTGRRVAVSTGEAHHLNSGFFWQGKLYSAHSNYPQQPERSEIKVLDPQTMKLTAFKEFGEYGGSLTWVLRDAQCWWCHFARYGDANGKSFLVKFDLDWKELARWLAPPDLMAAVNGSSLSGGVWYQGALLVTDHDNRFLYQLRIPAKGNTLQYVGKEPSPFPGQGIAVDSRTGGLVGIERKTKTVIFAVARENTGARQ